MLEIYSQTDIIEPKNLQEKTAALSDSFDFKFKIKH